MIYEEFLNKCRAVQKEWSGEGSYEEEYYDFNDWTSRKKVKDKPRLFVEWSTGGYSGGSCWEHSDPQPYTSDDKPGELQILDAILTEVCPHVTFLQYRALIAQLEKYDTRSVGEYYGNSTDYANKSIDVEDLYKFLLEKKFI